MRHAFKIASTHSFADPFLCRAQATGTLLDDLQRNVRLLYTPERAQVLLAAAQSPLLSRPETGPQLIPRLCNAILTAPSSTRHLLVKWWAEYPAELLSQRVVAPLQQYLTSELYATKKLTINVMNVIKVIMRAKIVDRPQKQSADGDRESERQQLLQRGTLANFAAAVGHSRLDPALRSKLALRPGEQS